MNIHKRDCVTVTTPFNLFTLLIQTGDMSYKQTRAARPSHTVLSISPSATHQHIMKWMLARRFSCWRYHTG